MKQFLLLFNLFLLTTLPINLFGADSAEPRAKQQKIEGCDVTFKVKNLDSTQEDFFWIVGLCGDYRLPPLPTKLTDYTTFLICNKEKVKIGFALVLPLEKENSVMISHFAIERNFQNKGYGSRLFEKIKTTFTDKSKFFLYSSYTAFNFYRKLGFRKSKGPDVPENYMEYTESTL
jgi:N-acetylglutamate synthase-like GNAT family acetyltransferase